MSNFIYPRVVAIKRQAAQSGVGAQAYGATSKATETTVATGVICSMQARGGGAKLPAGLPADTFLNLYNVFIGRWASSKAGLVNGSIKDTDYLIDELGSRYHVVSAYWDSLGFRLVCEEQEA